ncbi:MAG: hypothetical protein ABL893_00880 [Hyphomicrobium sp.]|nr:hypothetical protein [Hyphomicrobium sp.]
MATLQHAHNLQPAAQELSNWRQNPVALLAFDIEFKQLHSNDPTNMGVSPDWPGSISWRGREIVVTIMGASPVQAPLPIWLDATEKIAEMAIFMPQRPARPV